MIILDKNGIKKSRYWDWVFPENNTFIEGDDDSLADELKELLKTNKNKDEDEDEDLETLLRKRGCKTIDFTEPEYSDNEGVLGIWHGSVDNGCIKELPTASAKDDKRIEKDLKVLGLDGPVKTYVIGTSMG